MYAMRQASSNVTSCLDWNNNYGDEANKCILFHCGPVPQRMMTGPGAVVDHSILVPALGPGRSYGCNVGRISRMPFTYGGLLTKAGRINVYLGEGEFTSDPIPKEFFGCAGVAMSPTWKTFCKRSGPRGIGTMWPSRRGSMPLRCGKLLENTWDSKSLRWESERQYHEANAAGERFYACRALGGDNDHRDFDCVVVAGGASRPRGREKDCSARTISSRPAWRCCSTRK